MAERRPHLADVRPSLQAAFIQCADTLKSDSRLLAAAALTGGLPRVRVRSSPERVAREAQEFVILLAEALRSGAAGCQSRHIAEMARNSVRTGCFAAASEGEIRACFEIWRRAIEAFVGLDLWSLKSGLPAILAGLRRLLLTEARAWTRRRIDLIVIGASAGGIGPIKNVLSRLDPQIPATILIVQHISPKSPGFLPTVLARRVELAVSSAVDMGTLYLGHAYVAPPRRHLVIQDSRMRLTEGPLVHYLKPSADVLFESAALSFEQHLMSVILSGTGTDGAMGTKAVFEHGGCTIAQHPDTCQFKGMPETAIATGMVQHIIPIDRMAAVLEQLVREGWGPRENEAT